MNTMEFSLYWAFVLPQNIIMTKYPLIGKAIFYFILFSVLAAGLFSCSSQPDEQRVLVFSKTAGFRHNSIETGIATIQQLGLKHHFGVDTTEDAASFNEENLKKYQAVVFLNTTGDVLNQEQQQDFERFIQAGGGYVGVHAAADTEYEWPWYGKLAGAYFESHPNDPNVRKGTFRVLDKKHPATDSLPELWERSDEFYNFKSINPDIKVLVDIDENTYDGGTNGDHHPMSWYHEYDGGRAFYTGMGHTDESFAEPLFLKHLWGGIHYALGGDKPKELDYKKASSMRLPEENRFTKVVLAEKLEEPMELAVLDKKGRVLFVERRGNVKLYDPETQQVKVIAKIPVSTKYTDKEGKQTEAEDGLLGLALDPNFEQNNWLYLFYSPAGEEPKNVLSRFELKGDELIMASEKVVLEVPVQREQCCHTGGSIAFDAEGNLYVSTGDNTSPRATGYAPIDERDGRSPWDAQKSSANTNDLRGKILRIHPEADGSYTIPEGNLFAEGTEGTLPEIYTMGHRNPYRISVDKKTGFVYWGDVGPDAGKDSLGLGPKGLDEFNQAKKAGNYGWPHFTGDNKAYSDMDFASGKAGAAFDPAKPLNLSPNNTGLKELPAAQKAMIWYPSSASPEFPMLGTGGRSAMAGPVYRKENFKEAKRPFPDYYDGKWLIYEWMRGWMMAVSLDEEGNFMSMERFMPSYKMSNPIEMEFGPEGDLYMLEYGQGWFQGNDDARLVRIEYNAGNRKPEVLMAASKTAGALPLEVQFSSAGTHDADKDDLEYEWKISGKEGDFSKALSGTAPAFTFDQAGVYKVTLKVTDAQGKSASASQEIIAGNEPPQLAFEMLRGNRTFYFPGQSFDYAVKVEDKEDGSLENGGISPEAVAVTVDYLKEGFDQVAIAQGHRMADASVMLASGKKLMESSDCKACHAIDKKSVGPSYMEVAKKYKNDSKAADQLAAKVVNGGGGVWGDAVMPAHPQLPLADAKEIMEYVLSLDAEKAVVSLPVKGSYTTKQSDGANGQGVYIARAAYTDKGANGVPAARAEEVLILRNPKVAPASADKDDGIQKFKLPNPPIELVIATKSGSYIGFEQIDLSGIDQLTFMAVAPKPMVNAAGGNIEIRLGSPDGELIGEARVAQTEHMPNLMETPKVDARIKPTAGMQDLYFVFRNDDPDIQQPLLVLLGIEFKSSGKGLAAK